MILFLTLHSKAALLKLFSKEMPVNVRTLDSAAV